MPEGEASALDAGMSAATVFSTGLLSTTLVVGRSSRKSASRLVRARLTRSMRELRGLSNAGGGVPEERECLMADGAAGVDELALIPQAMEVVPIYVIF